MSVTNTSKRRGEILDEIMAFHREQLPKIMRELPESHLRAMASVAPPTADFQAALQTPGVSLIAECKKASPSKGLLVPNYDAVKLAKTYVRAGAKAISVLTDGRHFQGSLEDLRNVKELVGSEVPVLRKDFIFHPYQVYEARVAGADALLLIVSVLGDNDLRELLALTHKLEMQALVEVHTAVEVERALAAQAKIIGINNRNLQTFVVDFENTARLRQLIPPGIVTVGESGIQTAADVQAMQQIGVDAVLVGETLVKSKNVYQTANMLAHAAR
jgi:indole-3-glycerol phosphate synthase